MYNTAEISSNGNGTHPRRGPATDALKGALAPRHRGHGPPQEAEPGLWLPRAGPSEAEDAPTVTAVTAAARYTTNAHAASNAHRVLQRWDEAVSYTHLTLPTKA